MFAFKEEQRPLEKISPRIKPRISKRAKRLALRLDHKTGEIYLVIPSRTRMSKALEFAWSHKNWIREKLAELPPQTQFVNGAVIPIFGRKTTIVIYYDDTLRKTDIYLIGRRLVVYTNKEDPSGRITRYLKELAREEIETLAYQKAKSIHKRICAIQVRDTKSRWGSCGPDGRISFSWRLIFAPYEALDYVVAHEVAHLIHLNHGPRFWALCTELSSNFSKGKSWMRDHGHTLLRFG